MLSILNGKALSGMQTIMRPLVSERNPNVFYEVGLAHAIRDNVILLTQQVDDVPFDLRGSRLIGYTNDISGGRTLMKALKETMTQLLGSRDQEASRIIAAAEPSSKKVVEEEEDVEVKLHILHNMAQEAREHGHRREALQHLRHARDIAKTTGQGDVAVMGNCALEAEMAQDFDLAEELFKDAVIRDPRHVNNKQNYISFLLDHRPQHASEAKQMLDELMSVEARHERTLGLLAQWELEHTESTKALQELIALFRSNPGSTDLGLALARLLPKAPKGIEELRKLAPLWEEHTASRSKHLFRRAIADALGHRSPGESEEAVAIYKSILEERELPESIHNAVSHNLAAHLFQTEGKEREGIRLWWKLYKGGFRDRTFLLGFGEALRRSGKIALSNKVMAGEQIADQEVPVDPADQ